MSLSIRDEQFHSSKIISDDELKNVAMSGDDHAVIALLAAGEKVSDYRDLVENVDEFGHRNTADIIKKYHERPWLFAFLKAYQISDYEKWCAAILSLSQNRIIMLEKITLQLIANNKFDEENFSTVIARMAKKNKKIDVIDVKKHKTSNRSIFESNGKVLFYQARRAIKTTTLYGTRGKICHAYPDQISEEPLCAIKWMDSIAYAAREARCQQRLGRKNPYIFFYKSRTAVVIEWQSGKNLGQYSEADFLAHPLIRRIKCLISLLSDLNKLHATLHCHNDLNGGNIMLDFSCDKMALIDFELASKPRDKLDWQGDMSSVGEIIELLFPEIKKNGALGIYEEAMLKVREALLWKNYDLAIMPTSEQVLQYCEEIIARPDDLDAGILTSIADRTINRIEPTLEDMVRICERSTILRPR